MWQTAHTHQNQTNKKVLLQEAYRPPRNKYSLCCSISRVGGGTTHIQPNGGREYPIQPDRGYPYQAQSGGGGVYPSIPIGGTPIQPDRQYSWVPPILRRGYHPLGWVLGPPSDLMGYPPSGWRRNPSQSGWMGYTLLG